MDLAGASSGSSRRRPTHSSSSRAVRQVGPTRNVGPKKRAGRSIANSGASSGSRSIRERELITRKKQRSSKAAGKGALLILAIALIAIKAFSSLPSTVKTSSDQKTTTTSTTARTSTTFANSLSSTPSAASSGSAGSSVSPDQVVLPQVLPSSSSTTSSVVPKSSPPVSTSAASQSISSSGTSSANSLVTVRVFNGTTVSGAAGKLTNQLAQSGYDVVAPTNASTQNISLTTIYYSPGYSKAAYQMGLVLGLGTSAIKPLSFAAPIPAVQPSDLNVVLGTDKAN